MKKYLFLILILLGFSCSGKKEAEQLIAPFPADTIPKDHPDVGSKADDTAGE